MAEINLAPGTEYAGVVQKRRRRLFAWAGVIAAITAGVWGGLVVYQQQLIRSQRDFEQRLSAVNAEITRLGDQAKRVTLFEGRLDAVDALLSNHISWDPFLRDLERLLPPPVLLNRVAVSVSDNQVELTGEAPDIDVIAQTLSSLDSSPARPTIFTAAMLGDVNRVQPDGLPGEVGAVRYEFNAKLTFDSSKIRYGQ